MDKNLLQFILRLSLVISVMLTIFLMRFIRAVKDYGRISEGFGRFWKEYTNKYMKFYDFMVMALLVVVVIIGVVMFVFWPLI